MFYHKNVILFLESTHTLVCGKNMYHISKSIFVFGIYIPEHFPAQIHADGHTQLKHDGFKFCIEYV